MLAVSAVLVVLAAPSLTGLMTTIRLRNCGFDLFSTLVYARSEAITRNAAVTVAPVNGAWSSGWTVTDAEGNVLKRQDPETKVEIDGPVSVTYRGSGRLKAAADPFNITATGARAADQRCVSIDMSGRPLIKKVAC